MKYWIATIILTLFFVLKVRYISYSQTVSNATNYEMEYSEQIINLLGLRCEIVVVYMKTDGRVFGTTIANANGSYTIFVARYIGRMEARKIIIHEMAHVQQMQNGRLKNLGNSQIMWDDEIFNVSATFPGPHETDAEKTTRKLLKLI